MSRISPATVLVGFFAILCGLLGVFLVTRPLPPKTAAVPAVADRKITVPVASAALPAGRRITMGDIALLQLTRKEIRERGITGSFMASSQHIIGRVLEQPLAAGGTFQTEDLYPEGVGPGIGEKLSAGHRAVTVAVDNNNAVLGFATADSWVDVIFRSDRFDHSRVTARNSYESGYADRVSMTRNDSDLPEVTTTLLQRVRVLATDRNTLSGTADHATEDDTVSVTLEVLPEQAEKLRVVEGRGQLSLALRSPEDNDIQAEPARRTLDELLGVERYRVSQIEVYEHTRRKIRTFEQQAANEWTSHVRIADHGASAHAARGTTTASAIIPAPSTDIDDGASGNPRVVERRADAE